MTQLERELKATLQIQEEMFSKELKNVTKIYEKHLTDITTAYDKQMSEALEVIERQNKTLEKYHKVSQDINININEEQVMELESLFTKQRGELESLQRQLNSLERKL